MKVKAKVSFAGEISMFPGEVRDIPEDVAAPLLECGYLAALDEAPSAENPTVEDKTPTAENLDVRDLKKMKRADLEALAADMGIETKQLKTKDELVEAICAEDVVPGDESTETPELSAAMPTA